MMAPDVAMVAEVTLFAEGFSGAPRLARKTAALYRIAGEQLSQQVGGRVCRQLRGQGVL
jgi:dynein heavy chain